MRLLRIATAVLIGAVASGCGLGLSDFVRVRGPRAALTHVDVIDGTGAPVKRDQTILIEGDRIKAAGAFANTPVPDGAQVLDLPGFTVIPGLVGMHDHLFYAVEGGARYVEVQRSFAHLYLAAGVTTLRTAGAISLARDRRIQREIDAGRELGPTIHLTSEYLGAMPDIPTVIGRVQAAADGGATSVKAYTTMRSDELSTAINEAHRRGLKVTGHLCAVGFRQAAALGIDNLEHGLLVDTEFFSRKVADECPAWAESLVELAQMSVDSAAIQQTIRELVGRHVAVTSTLALFETFARPSAIDSRVEPLLTNGARRYYQAALQHFSDPGQVAMWERLLKMEMAFERDFVQAGGLLIAGADPTGWGGVVAGVADQHNIELLVGAGFTPEQAVRIATANGAEFLGLADRIGTIAEGKLADLVVLRGRLASDTRNIRNAEIVFKNGTGYDSAILMNDQQGSVGDTNWRVWAAAGIGAAAAAVILLMRAIGRAASRPRR